MYLCDNSQDGESPLSSEPYQSELFDIRWGGGKSAKLGKRWIPSKNSHVLKTQHLGKFQIEGTGTKQWVVYFVPNGANPADENAVNGEHYFDRIRDVIDHVLGSSASPGERSIGEMFEKEVMGESEPSEITTRTTRRSANNLATPID